ncbi:HNH endonuclease [Bordetella petrii]|uniref:HNH endonuclease n=1 Tax=Bordetella petrii TaxID=94624 RepID=UPI001A968273|nr:HNH endonuclease signature motif containing protein [Bordetella petrii]MBO1111844.1 HNH endonuclease [Bordetella petrii]
MDTHYFSVGSEYRRQELLDYVGSKQMQTGVIWGPLEPGCIICTSGGRHGKKAGYFDHPTHDGGWLYFGQGGQGDQRIDNAANSRLAAGDRSVLLFTTREPTAKEVALNRSYGKLFTFQGSFNIAFMDIVVPSSGPRKGDRLLSFHLVRAIEGHHPEEVPRFLDQASHASLVGLRRQLDTRLSGSSTSSLGLVEYRKRSATVRRYALMRANGICELCQSQAPFTCEGGIPYLEVHHLKRLADDGPDLPENVAAICPNCHRAVHFSDNRAELNYRLVLAVERKEDAISQRGLPSEPGEDL